MDDLPTCLVHSLLLEWLSPETVWTAVRASAVLRRHAQMITSPMAASSSPSSATKMMPGAVFRAAPGEVLSDPCVRWFSHWKIHLVLWTSIDTLGKHSWSERNGKLHSDDDLPAMTSPYELIWYQDGLMHRDGDKPAVIQMYGGGTELWYQNGKLHRDGDKPAVITMYDGGSQMWYQNGNLHRDGDQPAINMYDGGSQKWYQNGKLHRDGDKPAIVDGNGGQEWWLNGERQAAKPKKKIPE